MESLTQILTIVLPAGLVLYGMYITVQSFLNKEFEKRIVELKLKNNELIIPVRLQAYERVCLLLERISPNNLIIRVNESAFNSAVLHQRLLAEVREEFNHNLSQQVYISDEAWGLVKQTIQEINRVINTAAQSVDPETRSTVLAKAIFEQMMTFEKDPVTTTLTVVKAEIQKLF